MTFPISQSVNTTGSGNTSTSPFINVFENRDPTVYDVGYPIKKRWVNTTTIDEFILIGFNSSTGVVLANWQPLTSSLSTETLTGNTGGAVGPTSNNINVLGDTTSITIAGNPGTSTLTASLVAPVTVPNGGTGDITLTNHSVLLGEGTSPIAFAGPATTGLVLTANGVSADPSFQSVSASGAVTTIDGDTGSATPTAGVITISGGTTGLTTTASGSTVDLTGTLIVANGGTGDTSFTSYAVICGGTTSTGNLQSIASVGISGQILTSNGAAALSTFQDPIVPSYSLGTWTPVLAFGGSSTGITYTAENGGNYIKIGQFVQLYLSLALSSKGSATGLATVTGFPFSTISSGGGGAALSYWQDFVIGTNPTQIGFGVSTSGVITFVASLNNASVQDIGDTYFTNTTILKATCTMIASS